jgi:hypothetical protein
MRCKCQALAAEAQDILSTVDLTRQGLCREVDSGTSPAVFNNQEVGLAGAHPESWRLPEPPETTRLEGSAGAFGAPVDEIVPRRAERARGHGGVRAPAVE